jgi:outer membrane protein assembly factor BamB
VAVAAAETLWSFSFPRGVTVASALCADTATLYALGSDGVLYALSFQGRLRWQKKLFRGIAEGGGPYTNPLPLRDGLLVGETSGQLLRLSSQGELLWRHDRGARLDRNPVRDARGNVLLGILSGESTVADTLVLLDSTGHQRWARALPGTRLSCSPAAGNGLLVVAGVHSALDPVPVLHAFAETGELLWSQRLPATARWISLDDSGTAYVVVQSTGIGEPISGILAYDRQGKSLWRQYLRTAIQTPALLFGKSLLVFATRGDGALGAYIFGRSDGELRDILSLEEAPPVLLQPAVTPDGSVVLGWSTRLGLVRLGEHPWRWLVF